MYRHQIVRTYTGLNRGVDYASKKFFLIEAIAYFTCDPH